MAAFPLPAGNTVSRARLPVGNTGGLSCAAVGKAVCNVSVDRFFLYDLSVLQCPAGLPLVIQFSCSVARFPIYLAGNAVSCRVVAGW